MNDLQAERLKDLGWLWVMPDQLTCLVSSPLSHLALNELGALLPLLLPDLSGNAPVAAGPLFSAKRFKEEPQIRSLTLPLCEIQETAMQAPVN